MTILLKNTTEDRTITLRYGEGLNKLVQINKGETVELPPSLNKGLLQHYLSTFKGALKIIDDKEVVKNDEKEIEETNNPPEKVSGEEDQKKDPEDKSTDGTDPVSGEGNKDLDPQNPEDNEEKEEYTEKQLTKLSAEQVKDIAKSIGIEVTEGATKKSLIPIILDKQGKE